MPLTQGTNQPSVAAWWVRAGLTCAGLAVASLVMASTADPLRAAQSGPRVYGNACEAASRSAGGDDTLQLERWSAASELLWGVHPSAALRKAARQCQERLERAASGAAKPQPTEPARLRGMLAALEIEFERRLTENAPKLEFSAAELDGFPADWLQEFRVGQSSRFAFDLAPADYYPFMAMVKSPQARQRMYIAHANRGGLTNLRLLEQITEVRRQLALLQRQPTYGALLADQHGAPTPFAVSVFLDEIAAVIEPAAAGDIELLRTADPSTALRRWDVSRLLERARDQYIGQGDMADASRIPAAALIGWLTRYFGLLANVDLRAGRPAPWHSSVPCLDVRMPGEDGRLGRLCLDLQPRPGKYYNYATYVVPEGPGTPRTAVLLANVQEEKLSPDEVERVFGEFSVALSALTCKLPACRKGVDPSFARWFMVQRALFSLLAFSNESLDLLQATSPTMRLPDRAQTRAIQANRDFAVGLGRLRDLQIARFDHALANASGPVGALAQWIDIEEHSPLGHEPGTYLPSRLNTLTGEGGGQNFYGLWSEAAAHALLETVEHRTLQPPIAAAIRAAFFEPAAGLPTEQRFTQLAGAPFSLAPFARMVERNSIAAVAARRATITHQGLNHAK